MALGVRAPVEKARVFRICREHWRTRGQVNEFLELLREVWRFDRKEGGQHNGRAASRRHRDFSRTRVPFSLVDPPSFDDSIIAVNGARVFFFLLLFVFFLVLLFDTIRYIVLFRKKTAEQVVEF